MLELLELLTVGPGVSRSVIEFLNEPRLQRTSPQDVVDLVLNTDTERFAY